MAHISYDQSSTVRCPIHGKRSGLFVRPQIGDVFAAFYTCLHCAKEKNLPTDGKIAHEQRRQLPILK